MTEKSMREKLPARILSVIFHPLLLPTYMMVLLLSTKAYFALIIPIKAKLLILAVVFVSTFLLPGFIFFFMLRKKIIRSFSMESKEERIYPLLVTGVFFYLTYHLLRQVQVSQVYYLFLLGATMLVIGCMLISFYWKISLHLTGIGGVCGTLAGLAINFGLPYVMPLVASIVIAGLTGYARLRLDAHRPAQIYTGFILGAVVMFLLFSL
jgi:membrane-associated phospholipid phosphatase